MIAPELDFYAPLLDHKKMHKEKLSRQRDDIFSWRANHKKTTFDDKTGARVPIVHRYELDAKQVLIPGSRREADALKLQKQQNESIWDSVAPNVPRVDRRREWKASGFAFPSDHFRVSSDPRSPYHPDNRPCITAAVLRERQNAIARHPYRPYYHDRVFFSVPHAEAMAKEVTALTVTCNTAEAVQRELHASRVLRQARMMERMSRRNPPLHPAEHDDLAAGPTSLCEALGPTMASQQRQMELVEAMYWDLMQRQGAMKEMAASDPKASKDYASSPTPEGKVWRLDIPTGEIAYSLRPEYLQKHRLMAPSTFVGGEGAAATRKRSFVHTKREEVRRARGGPLAATTTMAEETSPEQQTEPMVIVGTESGVEQTTGRKRSSTKGVAGASSTSSSSSSHSSSNAAGTVHTHPNSHLLPAEAKGTRVYAIHLRKHFTNEEMKMEGPRNVLRHGVEVPLPDSWQSMPFSAESLRA